MIAVAIGSSMLISWWLTRGVAPDAAALAVAGHAGGSGVAPSVAPEMATDELRKGPDPGNI